MCYSSVCGRQPTLYVYSNERLYESFKRHNIHRKDDLNLPAICSLGVNQVWVLVSLEWMNDIKFTPFTRRRGEPRVWYYKMNEFLRSDTVDKIKAYQGNFRPI